MNKLKMDFIYNILWITQQKFWKLKILCIHMYTCKNPLLFCVIKDKNNVQQ